MNYENCHYWTPDSWGSSFPPKNVYALIDQANTLIDTFVDAEEDDYYNYSYSEYSNWLWEIYCGKDKLPAPYIFCEVHGKTQKVKFYMTEEEAIEAAENKWNRFSDQKRKSCSQFFVAFVEVTPSYFNIWGDWEGQYNRMIRDFKAE